MAAHSTGVQHGRPRRARPTALRAPATLRRCALRPRLLAPFASRVWGRAPFGRSWGWACLLALVLLTGCGAEARPARQLPAPFGAEAQVHGLAHIQRSLRLLTAPSAAAPERLRVLFYGQSISESAWARAVAERLRAAHPHARLEIENRALGGYAAERLVRTAETDVYPWQPDLVVLHAYGAHDKYEALLRGIRAHTSAEVLVHNDHLTRSEELSERTEPAAYPPDAAHWTGFMNFVFLPSLVARYQVALCDVRAAWKSALRARGQRPEALLMDTIHLNEQGDALMAQLITSCLTRAPTLRSPAESWVEVQAPRPELEFRGHRVDLTLAAGAGELTILIDGRAPSTLGLATFARAHVLGGAKWPPLYGVQHRRALTAETFWFSLHREGAHHRFRLRGSVSGDDGEGRTDAPFVSRSERVVIEPDDWDIAYAFELAGAPVPDSFELELGVLPSALDRVVAGDEVQTLTVASGLSPAAHVLTLQGSAQVRSITIYRAPLAEPGARP